MDSTFSLPSLAADEAGQEGSGWWQRRHLQRGAFGSLAMRAGSLRARPMGLSRTRVGLFLAAACLLAGAGAGLQTWLTQRQVVHDAALAALKGVDERMDAIEREISFLDPSAIAQDCTSGQVSKLLDASLTSPRVRHFRQGLPGADFACGPEGRGAPLLTQARLGAGFMLDSTGQIANRLVVTKVGAGGWVTQAELDSRVFDQLSTPPFAPAVAQKISLLSATGRRLVVLSSPEPGTVAAAAAALPALRELNVSPTHGLAVEVEVGAEPLWRYGAWRATGAALTALVLCASVTAWVWRRAVLRARLRDRISRALRRRQFEPHVQPIVDLATGRCVGGEVLMRWHHPQRGVLAPVEFIEEAERTGLIVAMSDLVMVRAAQRLAQLARMHPELYFSFNITPKQLRQIGFVQRLGEIFSAETLPRAQVLLELTEREFVDRSTRRALEALHQAGWRIAIDDFGTGQSSLASLEQLPVDRIKIDRAFVRTIDEQTVKRPVLDAIIALSDQLDVRLIAEGVETQAQWDYLRRHGVAYAQGYLFAKPMSIDAFARWLWHKSDPADPEAAPSGAAQTPRSNPINALLVDAQIQLLWQRLRTSGGLDVRTRQYGLRSYANCFVGREAVDWLVRHQAVDRGHAVRLGQRLMALGLISHVLDEHDFKDSELFYRLAAAGECAVSADGAAGLADRLRGAEGPRWRDQTRGLLVHRSCASGHEIVEWIVQQHAVARVTAVQWAAQWMRQGVLRHIFDDQPLRDDRTLYRLS